jgi:hypothetical protein
LLADFLPEHVEDQLGEGIEHCSRLRVSGLSLHEARHRNPYRDSIQITDRGSNAGQDGQRG